MFILRSSPPSPFGRKIKIAVDVLGVSDRMSIVQADTLSADDSLRHEKPLGKIPALILENGEVLFDSRVILEFLDALAGGGRVIPQGWNRFPVLRWQALADGIMDAGVLTIYEERWRPKERRDAAWIQHQKDKIARALAALEEHPPF